MKRLPHTRRKLSWEWNPDQETIDELAKRIRKDLGIEKCTCMKEKKVQE